MKSADKLLVYNIGELVTFAPLVKEQRYHSIREKDLGIVTKSWLQIENGIVKEFGQGKPPASKKKLDAKGRLVMPGLIDAHTHPLFSGSRAKEFALKLDGKTYQEIAKAGGGIQATVTATAECSDKELRESLQAQSSKWLQMGVTTFEAKSGYGLTVEEELRHLRILKKFAAKSPQHIELTCLALHCLPRGYTKEQFLEGSIEKLLPQVAKEKLARWVDAFIEKDYFTCEESSRFFQKAKELGLGIRVHADEFSDSGAASIAAEWQAASADHLQFASKKGAEAMGKEKVVAMLLPGTSLYSRIPFTQAKLFREANCPIGIATDYNPGSCRLDNLAQMATIGAVHCGLTMPEALAAVTIVPAFSLRLHEKKGALISGFDADFCVQDCTTAQEWLANAGTRNPRQVVIKGRAAIS